MIRAVFFDYDGVLTTDKTGSLTTCRFLSQASGIALPALKTAFARHNHALTLGQATYSQVWPEICHELGRELDIGLLSLAFDSTPVNAAMFALARTLKERYIVGIITDNKQERIERLKVRQGLVSLFSPIVVSAEVGLDKQSPALFHHALALAGVPPEDSVFIDNSRRNLLAAAGAGMRTVFHDDERNDMDALLASLNSLGVFSG